jgi:hypothetical protein
MKATIMTTSAHKRPGPTPAMNSAAMDVLDAKE